MANKNIESSVSNSPLTIEEIFSDTPIAWGRKHPREKRLMDIWKEDRGYLFWACGLGDKGKKSDVPPPPIQRNLIHIAALIEGGKNEEAEKLYRIFTHWRALSQEGTGLNEIPRPSAEDCRGILANTTLLCGHSDLDGIYSLAIAINRGGALRNSFSGKIPFSRIRLFNYGFRNLADYTTAIGAAPDDTTVIIDFSAHPEATLNLDHHATSLSYWELGTPIPLGVYDTDCPSCPRLLSKHCGLDIPEDILTSCDMVDGAKYPNVAAASDLSNPFVALEHVFRVDVSDTILKKVVVTLAENDLDPLSVLNEPIWQARLSLVTLELNEQRSYWNKDKRFDLAHPHVAVADSRLAPYSGSRFRFIPFENDGALARPYLITIRSGYRSETVNLGLSRNPFYADKSIFSTKPVNLGALATRLGEGGGRIEAASVTVKLSALKKTISLVMNEVENSLS